MADRHVTATGKDSDGDITKLCNNGTAWSPRKKADAIKDIEAGLHSYYTLDGNGKRAEVYVAGSGTKKYLTTTPDGSKKNNLDNLPDC